MKMSIALATYNGERYLATQLESYADQTRLPDQVVISDDGSTDETIRIAEHFRESAPFEVKVLRSDENIGINRNFERAVSACDGDIISLSDQDDFWFPDKLAVIERELRSDPHLMAITNDHILTDENLSPTEYTMLGIMRGKGRPDSAFRHGCCTSFRRRLVPILRPFPATELYGHDGWIGRFIDEINARKVHDTPLQYYRKHGQNASNTLWTFPEFHSRFREILYYAFADVTAGWQLELNVLELLRDRIEQHSSDLERCGVERQVIKNAVNRMENKRQALKKRIKIVSKGKLARARHVIKFYREGSYVHFSGLSSAIKDAIR